MIDIRRRRRLRTVDLDLKFELDSLFSNERKQKSRQSRYYKTRVNKLFYSLRSDKLLLLVVPEKLEFESTDTLPRCFLIEVDGVFHKLNRRVHENLIKDFSDWTAEESHCRFLFKREEEVGLTFQLIDYSGEETKTTHFVLQRNLDQLKPSDLRGPIIKFTKLDEDKLILFDSQKMYIVDTLNSQVICRKRYSHSPLEKDRNNLLIQNEILVLVDKLGYSFELFKIEGAYELEYVGEFRTRFLNHHKELSFNPEIDLKIKKIKRKEGNILLGYPSFNFTWPLKFRCIYFTEIDINQKITTKEHMIEAELPTMKGYDFDLIENDTGVLVALFNKWQLFVKTIKLKSMKKSKSRKISDFQEAPLTALFFQNRFGIEKIFVRGNLVFSQLQAKPADCTKISVLEVKSKVGTTQVEFTQKQLLIDNGWEITGLPLLRNSDI